MKVHRFVPLLLLVVVIVAVGCGATSDSPSTTTTIGATTTTTDGQAILPDGEHFGFVRQVADDTLVFDPAEFLSGEAALTAARADGAVGPEEELPNDFYIRNPDTDELHLDVSSAAQFKLIGLDSTNALTDVTVSLGEFARLWSGMDDSSQYYSFVVGDLPMTLTVSGGVVTGAVQQYLP